MIKSNNYYGMIYLKIMLLDSTKDSRKRFYHVRMNS